MLRVRWSRPSGYPGSQAQITEKADINLSVPVAMENASYVLTPGNRLQIEGQLDCVLIPLRGPVVEARLKELGRAWDETKQQASTTEALRIGLRDYRRQRERLSQTAVLAVVPGVIVPQPGAQLGDMAAARAADRVRLEAGRESTRDRASASLGQALAAPASATAAPTTTATSLTPEADRTAPTLMTRRRPQEPAAADGSGWVGEEA